MDFNGIVFSLFYPPSNHIIFNDPKPVCPADITTVTVGYESTSASLIDMHSNILSLLVIMVVVNNVLCSNPCEYVYGSAMCLTKDSSVSSVVTFEVKEAIGWLLCNCKYSMGATVCL
jgi:hypothetical protein